MDMTSDVKSGIYNQKIPHQHTIVNSLKGPNLLGEQAGRKLGSIYDCGVTTGYES